jgi:hypothetical protein
VVAGLLGVLTVLGELAAAGLRAHPLDPGPGWLALAALPGLALLFAGLGALGGLRAVGLAWALVWGPELARLHELSPWWALGAVVLLALPPRLAGALGTVGSVLVPLLRPLPPAVGTGPPGPVLITVDTVRADAGLLEAAGLADLGCRTGAAISASPWTLPAVASLWTGLAPRAHTAGVPVEGGWSGLDPELPGLHQTAPVTAILTNPHLRAEVGFGPLSHTLIHADDARHPVLLVDILAGWRGRLAGVPTPWDADRDRRVARAARAALEQGSGGLLWTHLLSPHEHARHDEGAHPDRTAAPVGPASYQHNVAWTAERVAGLVVAALERGRPVLVVADHGESFGEGGHHGHGTALVAEQLRVPAALCRPGQEASPLPQGLATTELRYAWLSGGPPRHVFDRKDVGGLRGEWRHGHWPDELEGERLDPDVRAAPIDPETWELLIQLGYHGPE